MIVVVCLNPALDVTYHVTQLTAGSSHQITGHHERAGGKGVNVARVLHQLQTPAVVLGFLGGHRGSVIDDELSAAGIDARWAPIAGETRQTVTLIDGDATVLREPGPTISESEWASFVADYEKTLAEPVDLVVLSGSLPQGLHSDAYAQLISLAEQRSTRVIVDTSGASLQPSLAAGPYLAKPNAQEMAGADPVSAVLAAGAANAVVSMGAAGLAASLNGRRYRVSGPVVTGNPTGAGDALTAALASGIVAGRAWPKILRDSSAVAAGAAALPYAGGFEQSVADEVRSQITVEEF